MAALPIDSGFLVQIIALLAAVLLAAGLLLWRQKRRTTALEASLAASETRSRANGGNGGNRGKAALGLMRSADFGLALDQAVERCDKERSHFSVLLVDLDNFASINESLGQAAGDAVLMAFARRVHKGTPDKRGATRMGVDQILVLVEHNLDVATELARQLVKDIGCPVDISGHAPVELSASIGVASYPAHGARAMIVGHAVAAARAAKEGGGGTHAVFDPKTAEDQRARAQLLTELREATAKRQFELFYQPKIDAKSLQVTAAEALIRWRHPTLGMVSPAVFIPIAERHGLICEIGNWVIEEACRQAGVWRKAGLRMRVAINLSAFQMRQDDLVDRLVAALSSNQLQAGRFTVEITESLAMENTQATQATFEGLRKAGLHVAIDDFGAGQTSLAYLRALPASELKLDISLVKDLETSPEARTIAEALIKLAHALKRRVVAEGVETLGQRDQLVMMDCDELQGFLFARPMSSRAFTLWALDERQRGPTQFRASLFAETRAAQAS